MLRSKFSISVSVVILILMICQNARGQFTERSEEVGIRNQFVASTYIGGGVGLIDVNNDELLDIFITGGVNPDRLYLNTGNGFERKVLYLDPEDFDLMQYETIGLAVGDVNNDGYDDILLNTARNFGSLLMINRGDETFDILTPEESGLTDRDWGVSAAFGDVNNDGLLDIFSTNYVDTIRTSLDSTLNLVFDHVGFNNYLYINQGGAFFLDMTDAYGVLRNGTTLSAAFTDFDSDRDVDLYVVNDFGRDVIPNEFYVNQYPSAQFEDRGEVSGTDAAIFGMGCAIGDYDGDLDLDFYMTNIGRNVLLSNNGDGTFLDVTNEAKVQDSLNTAGGNLVGWGTGFFDYDNDGWLDLYVNNGHIPAGTHIANADSNDNSLYRNNGDGTFSSVGQAQGLNDPSAFRGSAFGDLDNDGLLDLVFVPVNTAPNFVPDELNPYTAIYYNENENDNSWIKFKLDGVQSNRNGFGAHIYLYTSDGRIQMREADGGSSHASSNSSYIHFGLGATATVDSVVVWWPSGIRSSVIGPAVNQLHLVPESERMVTGVSDRSILEAEVFPNPFDHILTVKLDDGSSFERYFDFCIHTLDGKLMRSGRMNSETFHISTADMPAGSYIIGLYRGPDILMERHLIKK